MYILEWVDINDSGKRVSSGFYGGQNHKYYDMFNITITKEFAKKFDSYEDAKRVADRLNKVRYNFIVQVA